VGIYHLTPGDRSIMLPQLNAVGDARIRILGQDAVFQW
jgi:hypothetical protein